MKKIDRGDGFYAFMDANWSKFFPFPTSMSILCFRVMFISRLILAVAWKLHYDNDLPEPKYP